MGFWIFMLVTVLLVPLIMIVFGAIFSKRAPKRINCIYGYRTAMSMKNRDTWDFAHRYIGKLWLILGIVVLILSVLPMLFVLNCGEEIVSTVGLILLVLQMMLMIVPIIPTERALKKNFDRNGNRI